MSSRLFGVLITAAAIFSTSLAAVNPADTLSTWVNSRINEKEKALCQLESNGDYFFVAKSDYRLKTGYRLDITNSKARPGSYIIRWMFQNPEDSFIALNQNPELVKREYWRSGENFYVEEIEYQYIFLDGLKKLKVTVALNKYDSMDEAPELGPEVSSELQEVTKCEVVW